MRETSKHYNENQVIVRPAPIGDLATHANKVFYVGFGGDGHIGRLNLTHQFYQAFGTDTHNNLAGRREHINAQMFAFEGSYDNGLDALPRLVFLRVGRSQDV